MSDLGQYVDHQRWLMNNGMVNDHIKNQLFTYGAIVHKDIKAVDLSLNVKGKTVGYKLYVLPKLIKKIKKLEKLSTSNSLFSLWRLKRMLEQMKKDEERLDFANILNKFVSDFCGVGWSATIEVLNYDEYSEGNSEKERSKPNSEEDQSTD